LQRIPYLLVAGDKEVETKALAVRTLNGKDLGAMPLESLVARLNDEVASRGLRKVED
jgi:threonyl-tRNA synthetase